MMSDKKEMPPANVRVYTSKSGRRYAHTSDVICSVSGRTVIREHAKLSRDRKSSQQSAAPSMARKK